MTDCCFVILIKHFVWVLWNVVSCETLFPLWYKQKNSKSNIYLKLVRSVTILYCDCHKKVLQQRNTNWPSVFWHTLWQWFVFLQYVLKALAKSLCAFFNGHYLVVIRFCQSVRGKQRVLKNILGNQSLQLKSQACVCDCHLLSLPWEKVMQSGHRGNTFELQYVIYLFLFLIHYILSASQVTYRTCAKH